MTNQVKTVAVLTAHPGKAGELRTLLDGMVAPSRAEPGNLRYDLWADLAAPGRFVLDELYTSHAAVIAHRETLHFQNYLSHINALGERSAWTLHAVAVG
ncbi:putative quinol monooxygenase [Sphingomonas sp.]|uniref:putative quinol monooxygenase n=1 Tax=Sphingomonas sp. TaxID=28214 RepID=UPI001AFDF6AF|nr:putative quinol monooxygenase [Sphingomonas sp.]MBO9711639.1 antibiotic biosynthesis monooxygenase [Sphingomonas sp.]